MIRFVSGKVPVGCFEQICKTVAEILRSMVRDSNDPVSVSRGLWTQSWGWMEDEPAREFVKYELNDLTVTFSAPPASDDDSPGSILAKLARGESCWFIANLLAIMMEAGTTHVCLTIPRRCEAGLLRPLGHLPGLSHVPIETAVNFANTLLNLEVSLAGRLEAMKQEMRVNLPDVSDETIEMILMELLH